VLLPWTRVTAALRPLTETFRNPDLRRLQLAWVGSIMGGWSYLVALAVYAYAQGGAGAVALVGVLRMIPAAVVSPFAATLADRLPRKLVLIGSDVGRAALMGAAALVIASDGPPGVVYALVCASHIVGTPFRPAQAALLPALARTPSELTAANVASSTLEAVAGFAGPAVGGVLLAATNAQTVFAVNAASFVWSALFVVGIGTGRAAPALKAPGARGIFGHEALAGFHAIFRDRDARLLVALYTAQTAVAGALTVFVVTTALRLLERGPTVVGLLNAGLGVGGVAGGVVALVLAVRGRLATDFAVGVALFGAPLAFVAAVPDVGAAFAALCLVGVGNSLVDISAITLLQRIVPNEVLGRVVGALEGLLLGSLGFGAVVSPLLIHVFGIRWALVVVGCSLPAVVLVCAGRLRRLDTSAPEPPAIALLRGVEILAPLDLPTIEQLAAKLHEVWLAAGSVVIREGDAGDRFYVVEDGVVEIEGEIFGPGSSFGEIALLRDVPRTATVVAHTDVILQALEREDFLAAVTRHEGSSSVADSVIARRLGELRTDLTTEGEAA
jgi:MFS family permease